MIAVTTAAKLFKLAKGQNCKEESERSSWITGHKLRKSYKNSQELFIKKKGKENQRVRNSVFFPL